MINAQLIYDRTDGGRTIIEAYYPQSKESFERPSKKFSIRPEKTDLVKFKFRVGRPVDSGRIRVSAGDQVLYENKKARSFVPSIMESIRIRTSGLRPGLPVIVTVIPEEGGV